MANKEKEDTLSLVLSIFKGENFVCKNSNGFGCQIQAKCRDVTLHSSVIPVSSTNSEPNFNFQLAWQFTRRELRELRGNKEPVKVKCIILSDDCKPQTELGYAVLHVKNAFPLSDSNELDPAKAQSYPLLGTKDQWKMYHPKLSMQLHIEDHSSKTEQIKSSSSNTTVPRREAGLPSKLKSFSTRHHIENLDEIDLKPRVEVISKQMASGEKFSWNINDEEGCFELGIPSSSDDLYILNTTIVSASNLHLLWNGRSPKKASGDEYVWQVKYKAYGCEIKSDPFILANDDDSKRTFIGDKATARIRANPAVLYDYFQESAVEFHVLRFELDQQNNIINEEVMGVSFAELRDLGKSDITELKTTLEIVSEWGYPPKTVTQMEKPEVRVVFQLEATPEYFKNYNTLTQPISPSSNLQTQVDVDKNDNEVTKNTNQEIGSALGTMGKHDSSVDLVMKELTELALGDRKIPPVPEYPEQKRINIQPAQKEKVEDKETSPHLLEYSSPVNKQPAGPKKRPQHKTSKFAAESIEIDSLSPIVSSPGQNNKYVSDSSTPTTPVSSPEMPARMPDVRLSSSSSGESSSSKENLRILVPDPGTYKVRIVLSKFWLKRRSPVKDEIVLSYKHPAFGIFEDEVASTGKPPTDISHPTKPEYQCLKIKDGESISKATFDKFSENAINDPLTVEFRKYTKNFLEPVFAFSMIPIGNVLLQTEKKGTRKLSGTADILKCGENFKFGQLVYLIDFVAVGEKSKSPQKQHLRMSNNSNKSPIINERNKDEVPALDPEVVCKSINELTAWKTEAKEAYKLELKQKERAYLQILAEEAAARDKQRELAIAEKLADLKKKEKEVREQQLKLNDLEEKLRSKEIELAASSQKADLDHTSILENAKLTIRRMQEEHKIEISSLRRRNEEYDGELKKYKGKLHLFETKLEEKEEYIRQLKSERYETADSRLPEKLKLSDQENKLLRKQLVATEGSRDQYKKQSQTLCLKLARLQEERDKQLKDENESLRFQILASKEHKEMKKERKAVEDLSKKIRTMQDEKSKPKDEEKKVRKSEENYNQPVAPKAPDSLSTEDEIKRLTQMRNGLLNTGAYTQYDLVIKEMEKRIVGLAEGALVQ